MIPFYRKIRINLSDEHKFFKYFRYDIGEIILVVIGILIALQINNWNESRRLKAVEIKLLKELHNDLVVTLEELDMDIPNLGNQIKRTNHLIQYANDGKNAIDYSPEKFLDSFGYFNWNVKMYPRTIAYQNLKSMGFDLFSNDSIKYLTADVFDRRLTRIELWENYVGDKEDLLTQKMAEHFISYLYSSNSMRGLNGIGIYMYAPQHFSDLSNNRSILNELANMQNDRGMQLALYMELKAVILRLNVKIESEIDQGEAQDNA